MYIGRSPVYMEGEEVQFTFRSRTSPGIPSITPRQYATISQITKQLYAHVIRKGGSSSRHTDIDPARRPIQAFNQRINRGARAGGACLAPHPSTAIRQPDRIGNQSPGI